jgi:hypothetical protein
MNGDEAAKAQADYAPLAASACCEDMPPGDCCDNCNCCDVIPTHKSRNSDAIPVAETVLDEAARITSTDRQAIYGPPEENHKRTAELWSAYLGATITARQVCWLNVLQKASRDVHSPHRDALVDSCGYLRNAERCGE